jgi:hypothetical protein
MAKGRVQSVTYT